MSCARVVWFLTCARVAIHHARSHAQVGRGRDDFEAAKAFVQRWGQFALGWASVDPATPVSKGSTVCVVSRTLFAWTINPLRIV